LTRNSASVHEFDGYLGLNLTILKIPRIEFRPLSATQTPVFSIVIPSWNNLPYLRRCVESIRKNSTHYHEILVHVNEGKDGTLEWIKEQKLSHTHSDANAGVCFGFNAPASMATAPIIILSDDDYYFAPEWDKHLYDEISAVGHDYFCICGTMIEHTPTNYSTSIIATHDFGKTWDTFREDEFLRKFNSIPFKDWNGCNWYPMALSKRIWDLIGGLSTEFTPGMASDPDMMMKLWQCGVRYYKGVSRSRVYHFGSKSTARVKKNNGNKQFLQKWGLSPSTFFKAYLRLGEEFKGYTPEPELAKFRTKLLRDRLKKNLRLS
jgi:glycosyltransferase involved in cell wall biosynthesis